MLSEANKKCGTQHRWIPGSLQIAEKGFFVAAGDEQLASKPVSISRQDFRFDPRTGKIYVGEPEPLEELADLVGGLLGGLGRVADGLLGPAPVPIPIPVEDEGEQAPEQPPVGTDPYKYPGTY